LRKTCCLLVAIAAAAAADEPLAARVNGVAVPVARFERYFSEWLEASGKKPGAIRTPAVYKRFRREALAELLDEELLWQEATRARVVATQDQVDHAVARIKAGFPSREAYLRRLGRGGFTEATYAEHVGRELSIELWIERQFGAGEAARDKLQEKLHALRSAASIEVLAPF
jgi:hypothetical protein